jgi:hypothetical protein
MSRREIVPQVSVTTSSDVLDELAVDMRTHPAGALRSLLMAVLADDALLARVILKVERRLPKAAS